MKKIMLVGLSALFIMACSKPETKEMSCGEGALITTIADARDLLQGHWIYQENSLNALNGYKWIFEDLPGYETLQDTVYPNGDFVKECWIISPSS